MWEFYQNFKMHVDKFLNITFWFVWKWLAITWEDWSVNPRDMFLLIKKVKPYAYECWIIMHWMSDAKKITHGKLWNIINV